MKLPLIFQRIAWGLMLAAGPYIISMFVYVGLASLLQARGNDFLMFLWAGALGTAYWILDHDALHRNEPYSALVVVTNVTIALPGGAAMCLVHSLWVYPLYNALGGPFEYLGIALGLTAGTSVIMGTRHDLERRRYDKKKLEEQDASSMP